MFNNNNPNKWLFFLDWKAENWGGAFSLIGSLLASCAVDWQSSLATIIFLIASSVFNYKGEDYRYYSLGYTLIALGDIVLSFSGIIEKNEAARLSLYLFSFLAILGGLRYPLTELISYFKKTANKFEATGQKILNLLPATVGILNITFKLPAIALSLFAGEHPNILMAICYTLWMIADFLLNKVWLHFKKF